MANIIFAFHCHLQDGFFAIFEEAHGATVKLIVDKPKTKCYPQIAQDCMYCSYERNALGFYAGINMIMALSKTGYSMGIST